MKLNTSAIRKTMHKSGWAIAFALLLFNLLGCDTQESKDEFLITEVSVEHFRSPLELEWGLMGRDHLSPDKLAMFHLEKVRYAQVWMLNVSFDLSVAFVDADGIITEIHQLESYPEKMDPKRPIKIPSDLQLYPLSDPIIQFFHKRAVLSKYKIKFMIESPYKWFENYQIAVGDRIKLDNSEKNLSFYSNHW